MKIKKLIIIIWTTIIFLFITSAVTFYAVANITTYENIRKPQNDHYHFRIQILVSGQPVNFAQQKFQMPKNDDICTDLLTREPIHFHDGHDQMVHIHWEGISGGQFLKYYGWNEIGGLPQTLGFTLNDLRHIKNVKIKGNLLPLKPKDANYFVYVGDKTGYQEKFWKDFVNNDLERFFNKSYDDPDKVQSLMDLIIRPAYARTPLEKPNLESSSEASTQDKDQLTQINTLIGNVVIFVQNERPTDEQIKIRFNQFVPLDESSCGG